MDVILKYTLKKIQEQTSLIPYLNSGGCCHFAKLLSKELEQRNIKFKVTLMDDFKNYISLAIHDIKIRNKEYVHGVGHIGLKLGKYYIDGITISSNVNNLMSYTEITNTSLTYKDLKFFSTAVYWNSAFNKRKYHSIISKIIKEQFKIYDKLQNDRK